jgi:hypothetical protein
MGIIAFAFVKTMVTETKGRSLEEIEGDLQEAAGGTRRFERKPDRTPSRPAS